MRNSFKLSVIIPAFNEEKTIGLVLKKLMPLKFFDWQKEVIVVNDASTDKTCSVLKKFSSKIKVVNHSRNCGKGASIRSGIKTSTGDYIIVQDADLEYDPQDIEVLVAAARRNPNSAIYGSRFRGKHEDAIFGHKEGNQLLTLFTNVLFGSQLSDMETCYKLIPSRVFKKIKIESNRFDFEPEITTKLIKLGVDILEVPVSYNKRGFSEGKRLRWWRDGPVAVWTLIKFRFLNL